MKPTYFKHRGRFDFSPHRYEIGNPISQDKRLESNLFLVKLYKLHQDEYPAFYQFHLGHFLKQNLGNEETFFYHVKDITLNRIKHFKRLDPFSSKYAFGLEHTPKLESFQQYLSTIDQWSKRGPLETMIDEKDALIERLKEQIEQLEAQIKEQNKYEAGEKVVIAKGKFAAFMDLVLQVQELTLPNGHKFARSQTQSPWYKMIAKYFQHGENEIPIDTARNYFPAQKHDKPAKFIEIAEKDKLFIIKPKERE
jgi:hypothetical protein